jgi:hypothetical protein
MEPDPDPYPVLLNPDPGGPKTYGSYGSWSATLLFIFILIVKIVYEKKTNLYFSLLFGPL